VQRVIIGISGRSIGLRRNRSCRAVAVSYQELHYFIVLRHSVTRMPAIANGSRRFHAYADAKTYGQSFSFNWNV